MKNAVIDYETYYDDKTSVVHLGNFNYTRAADAYIVGVLVDGEATCGTIKEMQPFIDNLAKDQTVRPVAANSNFDQAWQEKYGPAFKNDWYCVLDHACFCQFPRNLASLSGVVLGERVDKTLRDQMKGVRYEDLSADQQEKMQEYCANDCIKELEVLEAMPPMSAFEEKVASHTRMMNRRGVAVDLDLVDEDKTKLEQMRFDAFRAIPWHADAPPLSYQQLAKYCAKQNLPVPKSLDKRDEECAELMTDNAQLGVVVGHMRNFRRANTVLKKLDTLVRRTTPEGILPLDILYCGAPHTRRWSSKGFNIQNLDKEPLKIDDETSVWTRTWIIPRPGKKFFIPDLAQIEPRCLNWLAGNEDMMEALRHGFSYYEAYLLATKQAKRVGWSGKSGTLKKEIPIDRYTKVKNESLGCGYGMGATKYQTYAHVDEDEAEMVIKTFRANNPLITKLWRKLDNLITTASRDKSKHLSLEMPTGDLLQYFNVRAKAGGHEGFVVKGDFGINSRQGRLWGGVLTENITQRMARDVLAGAVLNLEAAGFPVMFHSHDEVILEVDAPKNKKQEDEICRESMRILTQAPDWAPNLPLGAEGDFADSYTK